MKFDYKIVRLTSFVQPSSLSSPLPPTHSSEGAAGGCAVARSVRWATVLAWWRDPDYNVYLLPSLLPLISHQLTRRTRLETEGELGEHADGAELKENVQARTLLPPPPSPLSTLPSPNNP